MTEPSTEPQIDPPSSRDGRIGEFDGAARSTRRVGPDGRGIAGREGGDKPSGVSLRSVLLGLIGVVFITGLTPYNDYVVRNTYMVGNFMPIGLLLFFLSFIIVINGALWRWLPRQALGSGELAVSLAMVLCACAIPSSGLMRFLPANLTGLWHFSAQNHELAKIVSDVNLPDWMFPHLEGQTPRERGGEWLVGYYRSRIPPGQADTDALWSKMWAAWVRPVFTWAILVAAVWGAVLMGAVIVRRQWAENERLAFPLANLYAQLLEQPEPGRALNALFRSRSFWIAAVAVFVVHGINALNRYHSEVFPQIPLSFDLTGVFSEAPWSFMSWWTKRSTLYFCVIGFAYFLQSQVAFSLWFFCVVLQGVLMTYGAYQTEFTGGAQRDQFFGAIFPYVLTLLWIGRAHWGMVIRRMFGQGRPDDATPTYLPYGFAGWALATCLAVVVAWLMAAGATLPGSLVIVGMMFLFFLVIARIVAETGLIFAQVPLDIERPFIFGLTEIPGGPIRTTGRTFLLGQLLDSIFMDLRESLSVYATTALRVTDRSFDRPRRLQGLWIILAISLAMGVGYFTAWGSTLWTEYAYASSLDQYPEAPISGHASNRARESVLNPTKYYLPPGEGPQEVHNRTGHFVFGAALTAFLSVMRLRFAAWPLHPVGFLLVYSYPMMMIWFSIFLGWLAKALIVRFGGTNLYRDARPAFVGMIIGEASAAAFWLVVSLVLSVLGMPYHAISLLPG